MKKLLIALSIFFIGSCTVAPKEEFTISPEEIAEFAAKIKATGLVFAKETALVPFEIASDGTYTDAQGIPYQIIRIINDNTVLSTSIDFGEQIHELVNGVFGITFQEIAFTPVSPAETLSFREKVNAKNLDSEQSGSWKTFLIAENGTYTTDNTTYTITRIINEDSVLVAKSTGGTEIHGLVDSSFGAVIGSTIYKDLAFRKATSGDLASLRTKLASFIVEGNKKWDTFSIPTDKTTYTIKGITYEIGKVIDENNYLVAKSPSGTENHRINDNSFGPINSGNITEIAFKKATTADINQLNNKLNDFIFLNTATAEWDEFEIVPNDGLYSYIVNNVTYQIGRITGLDSGTPNVLVMSSTSGKETHKIIDESSFVSDNTDKTIIAFVGSDEDDKKTFLDKLDNFIFTKAGEWQDLTKTTTTYTIDEETYTIGRVEDDEITILVTATSDSRVETHRLCNENSSIGPITTSGGTTFFNELAFRKATSEEVDPLREQIRDFKYAEAGEWTTFGIPANGIYTVRGAVYEIGKVFDSTSILVSKNFEGLHTLETHKIVGSTNFGPIHSEGGIPIKTEIAIAPSTIDNIQIFANKINNLNLTRVKSTSVFEIDINTYSHAPSSVEIGRVIDENTILVAVEKDDITSVEVHGYRNGKFGVLGDDNNTIIDVIAEPTALDALKINLTLFVYAKVKNWSNFPDSITTGTSESILGSYTVSGTNYNITTINDLGTSATVVNLSTGIPETHEIRGSQYGVVVGDSIKPGTEVAIIPTPIDDIKRYMDLLKNKDLIFPDIDGKWTPLTITPASQEIDNKYKIIRIYNEGKVDSKILVSATVGQEVHQFVDPAYLNYQPGNVDTIRDHLAFVRITDDAKAEFINKINALGLSSSDGASFRIDADGTYSHSGKTYSIGRYVDDNTVYVVQGNKNMTKHGIKDGKYGILNDDSSDLATVIAKPRKSSFIDNAGFGNIVLNTSLVLGPDNTPYVAFIANNEGNSALNINKHTGSFWDKAGSGLEDKSASSISLTIDPKDNSTFIAFSDKESTISKKLQVYKLYGSSTWVDTEANSIGQADHISSVIHPNGTLYVAYQDNNKENKATVRQLSSTDSVWSLTGDQGFSEGKVEDISLAITSDNMLYIAYIDKSNGNKATVMKFEDDEWKAVGNDDGFSDGEVEDISLAIALDNTPYVAYKDKSNGNKATVMKFEGGEWKAVGDQGFSNGAIKHISLAIDLHNTPYVAYADYSYGQEIQLMRFDGSTWKVVSDNANNHQAAHISLVITPNGTPYIAYVNDKGIKKFFVKKFE